MTIASAGMRRHVVTVEEHDGTSSGGAPTWTTEADWDSLKALFTVPAAYQGVSGGEFVRGFQVEAEATGLVRMASTPRTRRIKPKMRLRRNGRKLNILSVTDRDGEQRELWIQVREEADA